MAHYINVEASDHSRRASLIQEFKRSAGPALRELNVTFLREDAPKHLVLVCPDNEAQKKVRSLLRHYPGVRESEPPRLS